MGTSLVEVFKNKRNQVLLIVSILLMIADQWTKVIVLHNFYLGESIPVIPGFFNFTYVQNRGAAFGFLAWAPEWFRIPFFIILPVLALGFMGWMFKGLSPKEKLVSSGLMLIFSGAVGNLIDRIRLGYVVDFLDFFYKNYHYPAFNIADSCITVGVCFLLIDSFQSKPKSDSRS